MKEIRGALDHLRGAVTIPRRLMPAVLALHTGTGTGAESLAALQANGIAIASRLHPLVAGLLQTMTDPTMVVSVDVDRHPQEPRLVTFWQKGSMAVAGVSERQGLFHLTAVAPELLPFHIAAASDVRVLSQPSFSGSTVVEETSLSEAEETVGTAPSTTERILRCGGMPRTWAERFTAALLLRQSKWEVEVVWLGAAGREHGGLTVLNSGHAGYWLLVPVADGQVRVTPIDVDQLLEAVGRVLPPPGWLGHRGQSYD